MKDTQYFEQEAKKLLSTYLKQRNVSDKNPLLNSFGAGFRQGLNSRDFGRLADMDGVDPAYNVKNSEIFGFYMGLLIALLRNYRNEFKKNTYIYGNCIDRISSRFPPMGQLIAEAKEYYKIG